MTVESSRRQVRKIAMARMSWTRISGRLILFPLTKNIFGGIAITGTGTVCLCTTRTTIDPVLQTAFIAVAVGLSVAVYELRLLQGSSSEEEDSRRDLRVRIYDRCFLKDFLLRSTPFKV